MYSKLPNPLQSKLCAPVLTPFHLHRTQLGERLEAAADMRVIVLRAPAGFGKTTAMLQHAARTKEACRPRAWLTLDAADNDLGRFLAHLDRAIEEVAPRGAQGAQEGNVLELIERIAASTSPFVLFLDDFDALQSSSALDVIRQVLEYMPPAWQLVIGSRIAPSLGLGRLRARGQVLEIGLEHLRFSVAEATDFLRERRGLDLSPELISRLHDLTEGWATALWLASVALNGHQRPDAFLDAFSGSDSAINEFLAEEVLATQPDALREFLLRTSVLQQLNAPLCDAMLERHDSADMLSELERSNLFLISLDVPGHYRYHSLFADFLRAQLARRAPDAFEALHLRAAQWYETEGRPVSAIEHALRAGDFACVTRLLEIHAQQLLHVGRFRLLARWFDGLPPATLEDQLKLRVMHAWTLALTHRYQEALALLTQLEAHLQGSGEAWDDELRANMLGMRPVLMLLMDNRDALPLAIENHARLDPRHRFPYSLLTNSLAMLYAVLNRFDEARALLDQARRSHFQIGSTFSLVFAECIEGTVSLRQGRLQDAVRRFRLAMNNMTLEESRLPDGHALAAMRLAEALYEAGQFDQAERILRIYLPLAREYAMGDFVVRGHITLARLAWHRGENDRALGSLGELEYQGYRDGQNRLVICAELERSRLALLRGDNMAAAAHLRRVEALLAVNQDLALVVPLHDVESVAIARMRLKIRAGQTASALAEALAELPPAIEQARQEECLRLALHLTLLWIEALQRTGQVREARERLAGLLEQAALEGIVTPFADEGPLVAALALGWWRTTAAAGKLLTPALATFGERLESVCAAVAGSAADAIAVNGSSAVEAGPGEGLTLREIHVLKLLAQGKSNAAIAEGLFVSENTVRTHLRNISAKLGASNRTEAVVLARKRGLIA